MPSEHNKEQSNEQKQIEQLETKVAYLEHHIEQLNDAMVELQLDNKTAKDALKYLYQQVQSIGGGQGSQNSGSFIEPPPPHY
ncbi:MAG: SlyX protein [Oleispira sp.]|jgi:SlyX protein